jgi:hypothetical protein
MPAHQLDNMPGTAYHAPSNKQHVFVPLDVGMQLNAHDSIRPAVPQTTDAYRWIKLHQLTAQRTLHALPERELSRHTVAHLAFLSASNSSWRLLMMRAAKEDLSSSMRSRLQGDTHHAYTQ